MSIGAFSIGEVAIGEAPGPGAPITHVLAMALEGTLLQPAASLAMTLSGLSTQAAASLAMALEGPDPAHYLGAVARFGVAAVLDGTALGDIVGPVTIRAGEDASTTARLAYIPGTGAIDLADYERKHLEISFVGYDSDAVETYRVRQFTGTTTLAEYDPDSGTLTLLATTDLQGWLENLERAVIDALIGGQWSAHIFDSTADGYQYALDRLSTLPACMYLDEYGQFQITDWAAKPTADVELTDAARFDDSLALTRASRRDLLTQVRINLDFRFVRLRHRELAVEFTNSLGFCHYLNNNWPLASKDMVRAAADGSEWTRISDITFEDTPGVGTYCNPPRGWTGGAEAFCLGARWRAARRWAQTVTEAYTLDVIAPDLAEAIGVQAIAEDYGITASFDGNDFERVRAFDAPPTGASLSTASDDWQLEATDAEYDGRAAMQAAQACALAKARVAILKRARSNRMRVRTVFRPDITLASTVRINTPHLVAKGKVASLEKIIDPGSGRLELALELALSRHGGSGSASDTPLAAADAPDQPDEVASARTYIVPYRLGGLEFSPADDPDWDGYMVNVQASLQFPGSETYRQRFVVRMPAIEATARDASEIAQPATYTLIVPQDELTLSN